MTGRSALDDALWARFFRLPWRTGGVVINLLPKSQLNSSRKSMDAMSHRTKQRRSGGLTLLLYQRTLHPELFTILASEKVSRRAYDAEIWLVEGGHVTTLTAGKNVFTEVIVTGPEEYTDRGLMQKVPCRGEKYHETQSGNIRYMISTQEEQLSQTLYDATSHEMLVQSFHLFDETQMVMKTQAIIEVIKGI